MGHSSSSAEKRKGLAYDGFIHLSKAMIPLVELGKQTNSNMVTQKGESWRKRKREEMTNVLLGNTDGSELF